MREINWKYFNLFTILRDMLCNWWVILMAGIIGISCCQTYYMAFEEKQYTSKMTVAINLSGYTQIATTTSLGRTIEIATSFQNVLQSPTLVQLVEKDLGEELTGTLKAKQIPETNLIDISVTDTSPEKAYRTLGSVFDNYSLLTGNAFNNVIVNVISRPDMPASVSSNYKLIRNSITSALLAMALCSVIILIISYFRDTVKNVSDVENLLDGKLFGTVYHINKRRCHLNNSRDGLLLTNPLITYYFSRSFRQMAVKLISLQRTRHIRSVMLTSIAENEGKTTTSVNLAIALAEAGKKVLLVDADFKLPADFRFFDQVPPNDQNELGEYLLGRTDYQSVIRYDKRTGLYLAGGQKQYRNSSELINGEHFRETIKRFEEDFDIVLIDTPPAGIAVDSEIISEIASVILFVVRQDFAPVEPINDFLSQLHAHKLLGCIFNDVSLLTYRHLQDDLVTSEGGETK